MQGESITVGVLRTLNRHERETLTRALEKLTLSPLTPSSFRQSARAMLDQNMVDNFMWGTK